MIEIINGQQEISLLIGIWTLNNRTDKQWDRGSGSVGKRGIKRQRWESRRERSGLQQVGESEKQRECGRGGEILKTMI